MPRLSKIGAAALAAFGWTGLNTVSASYLVVAGGGGGGDAYGGGGGAGGYLTGTTSLNPTQSYTVTVGAGGAGSTSSSLTGNQGSNSVFNAITSTGGGGGGSANDVLNSSTSIGANGGSGGGGAANASGGTVTRAGGSGNTPSTSPSQGNNGGSGVTDSATYRAAGGGGGSFAVGSNGTSGVAGAGGAGTPLSISGASVTYAGGGGGGGFGVTQGAAGTGGGGAGGVSTSTAPVAGTANLGGGGGGSGDGTTFNGASGGSGVVIISYPSPQKFGGGVVTTSGANTIHTFTTSGTLSPLNSLTASALIVAGGGGGAYERGGGGGAGGMQTPTGLTIDTNSIYVVTVGSGGAGSTTSVNGTNGTNSTFSIYATASVGGGGGSNITAATNGSSGGSGGGGSYTTLGGAGTSGQGNAGGNGESSLYVNGGGGGGAGGAGQTPPSSSNGGNGGVGSEYPTSSGIYYAGGAGGTGGTGGGGAGGQTTAGTAGTANTGGGGGGGGNNGGSSPQNGGAGGSGIVIISYAGATQQMAGGTVTISGGNVIHTFTSSGYLTPLTLVGNSLRFRSSASAYLNRTPPVASNRKTWTWSGWVKRGALGSAQIIVKAGTTGVNGWGSLVLFNFTSTDILRVQSNNDIYLATSQVFRDPAAWYHIVFLCDTTQATATNRLRMFVNGSEITAFSTDDRATYISQNSDSAFNNTVSHEHGRNGTDGNYLDGYLTEINFIDGQGLTPNSFGSYNSYGVWQPITYGGSYGTNGFYLPFTNTTSTTTLGYDFSPQGNNWTTNNISLTAGSTYDSMTDVPTLTSTTAANYAVWNCVQPPGSYPGTFTNGNLKVTSNASTAAQTSQVTTMAMPATGNWYAEITVEYVSAFTQHLIGIVLSTYNPSSASDNPFTLTSIGYGYNNDGNKRTNSTNTAYGATWTTGDVIGIQLNNGTLTFYKQTGGTGSFASQGSAFTGLTGNYYFAVAGYGSDIYVLNAGQQPFNNSSPPSGALALNTFNL
jgi:hypothetical protein